MVRTNLWVEIKKILKIRFRFWSPFVAFSISSGPFPSLHAILFRNGNLSSCLWSYYSHLLSTLFPSTLDYLLFFASTFHFSTWKWKSPRFVYFHWTNSFKTKIPKFYYSFYLWSKVQNSTNRIFRYHSPKSCRISSRFRL